MREPDDVEHEEPVGGRIERALGLLGRRALRDVVDARAHAQDQRDQLRVQAGQPAGDAVGGRVRHHFDPVRQRIGRDPVALPHREVQHDLQLLGRRRREQRSGVLVAELVEHVVKLVAGQGPDGRVGVAVREQHVRAAQAAAAPQLGPERGQGDDVGGLVFRRGDHRTGGYSAKLAGSTCCRPSSPPSLTTSCCVRATA